MADNEYVPSPWEPIADHVERYLATGGADGAEWEGAQTIVLETTGAKSGAVRRTPLIRVADDNRYLVVASMGGAPQHPNWYHNVVAHPEVRIYDHDQVHDLRARTASPSEKADLWPLATAQWPSYDDYQKATERDIPLVICEPR